jgi:hypothetical protein
MMKLSTMAFDKERCFAECKPLKILIILTPRANVKKIKTKL